MIDEPGRQDVPRMPGGSLPAPSVSRRSAEKSVGQVDPFFTSLPRLHVAVDRELLSHQPPDSLDASLRVACGGDRMRRYLWMFACATTVASVLLNGSPTLAQEKAGDHDAGPPCTMRQTNALYGFQCHGTSLIGSSFEPVTFIGVVEGDGKGLFEGTGTFSSSMGSLPTHVKGTSTPLSQCFGHVTYSTNEIVLPNATIPLEPIQFDYTVVDGGREILGTGTAPTGVLGVNVPRMTCRLVRVR